MRDEGAMLYIDDVITRVKGTGSHFFSKDTMRAFHSRVSDNAYPTAHGTYFVTSERDYGVYISSGWLEGAWDGKRRYTVRFCDLSGSLHATPGGFCNYASWNGAHKAAKRLQKTGFPTCEFADSKCPHDWSKDDE